MSNDQESKITVGDSTITTNSYFKVDLRRTLWKCEKHGKTDAVMHINVLGKPERTFCVECLADMMAAHGVADIADTEYKEDKP